MPTFNRKRARARIHRRIRKTLSGNPERPRLSVHFSGRHVHAQIIDDTVGKTLAAANTTESNFFKAGSRPRANCEIAAQIGKMLAERAKSAKISKVVFDRGGFHYHGKVKALADAAREGGLEF